jgi:hypothetical protein
MKKKGYCICYGIECVLILPRTQWGEGDRPKAVEGALARPGLFASHRATFKKPPPPCFAWSPSPAKRGRKRMCGSFVAFVAPYAIARPPKSVKQSRSCDAVL